MAEKLLIQAIHDGLDEALAEDERVVIFGEDVGTRGGVFRVTDGLKDKYGPMRVIDAPLAESLIIGAGVGMAANGLIPIAEMQFQDFSTPAMDQIMSEVARLRYRSNGDWGCPMVIRMPYGGGIHGALYHSQSIEAIYTHVPGLKVVAPIDPYDAKGLLREAVLDPDPVIYFEHKKAYRAIRAEVPDEPYTVPIGKAKIVREGSDLTIISYGAYLYEALQAADDFVDEQGGSIEVIDLRTLKPLDNETILESVMKTGKALIVHEANRFGGIGGEIAAIIAEEAFAYLDGPVVRLTSADVPAMPYSPPLEKAFLLDKDDIRAAIDRLTAF
ncbi:MAG: alpha-ketoacid dehydrogenase subunit beta [Thermomicrobiales bacterium]